MIRFKWPAALVLVCVLAQVVEAAEPIRVVVWTSVSRSRSRPTRISWATRLQGPWECVRA